ncbi:MAG: sarcosine oxidase subunit gamma [Devosia sp.]|nr:sarcosine oxidase subunit gamma [Devosia sp.]
MSSGVEVERRPAVRMSVLRLRRPFEVTGALDVAFGHPWPNEAGRIAGPVYWLGPGEWAIVGLEPERVEAACLAACAGATHHLVHVGEATAMWRISGPSAGALIARGCSLDTHPRAFAARSCARTLFAQVPALLARPGDEPAFELIADISHADYLRGWLEDARTDC